MMNKSPDGPKIAVIGNVDAGKSSLVGVLSKGIADDGRGGARLHVCNYSHEIDAGKTSSIAQEIMGFDANGKQVFPDRLIENKNKYWAEVMEKSQKVVCLVDLCGHEKYLKTTMFGLVGIMPDYAMIIIGGNMGISRMTKEHLGITLSLKIPFFVVLTKVDMCPENIYKETVDNLLKILKSRACNKKPIMIKTQEDVQTCAAALENGLICPVFSCSSVTREGIDYLSLFISLLSQRIQANELDAVKFDIKENFMVAGIGIVVSGVMRSGTVRPNAQLLLGPDKANAFRLVTVKTIHVNRVMTEEARGGQMACFSIKAVNKKETLSRDDFKKGMILIDPALNPQLSWEFEAEIAVLHNESTIKVGYQPILHCGMIAQAVSVKEIHKHIKATIAQKEEKKEEEKKEDKKEEEESLRSGDKGRVKFKFLYHPEYMEVGQTILLREAKTKIMGLISKVF